MWGHQNAATLPAGYPQYFARGQGAHVWDVDGNEYVDLMCSWGPIILGHHDPRVDAAASRQQHLGDAQNGPAEVMVELAESLVRTVRHADWALFQRNGTDATTIACTVARSTTGRSKILVAEGAYHGSDPWCTPVRRGTTPEDRANYPTFRYNDLASLAEAVERCDGDLAGILVSPFRHDARIPQELPSLGFARGLRGICDANGAALILDDVRAGFRLAHGSSWEPLGVEPDLSAWSKGIANGYALGAVLGTDAYRDGARRIYATGSFWCGATSMAAALATIAALAEDDAVERMTTTGTMLRDGLDAQARAEGVTIVQSGPVQMPMLTFAGDDDLKLADLFCVEALRRGAYLHPWHNWFLSSAHTPDDIARVLEATAPAFAAVARAIGD